MTLEFFDRQLSSNPANGTKIEKEEDLARLLNDLLRRKLFFLRTDSA